MTSDWHIGCGKGEHGGVDALVDRDKDGLPFIVARSVRGMWRDAAEQLAFGLDEGEQTGSWQKLLIHIFGSQPALPEPDEKEDIPEGATGWYPWGGQCFFAKTDQGKTVWR